MPTATAAVSVEDAINRRRGDLIELSHSIHAEPELAFAEFKSCAKTQALVAERGFEISASPGGLDTAFRAEFGSGPLVIGICAEYDALPGLGHACGHNIIAASAVGTALALAEVADDLGLKVVLLGTPAEESGGGKVLLLNAGTFDDIAATVMLHPGPIDIARARSLAAAQVEVTYLGREAHAAVAPYLGVNAADAITVAQTAIGLLRQQFAPGEMAHGIVTDGGFRDSADIAKLAIPAFHNRPSAPTNLTLHQAIDINVPIGCGDAPIFPGDVVVGDGDGVGDEYPPPHATADASTTRATTKRTDRMTSSLAIASTPRECARSGGSCDVRRGPRARTDM